MRLLDDSDRYGWISIGLHWAGAAFVMAMLFIGNSIRADSAGPSGATLNTHLTIGLLAYPAAALRCAWRLKCRHPAPLRSQGRRAYQLGKALHHLLLAAIAVMLVSGPCLALTRGYPLHLFGLAVLPPSSGQPGVAGAFSAVHVAAATVLGWGTLLHVMAVIKHTVFDRDGSLDRILATAPIEAAPFGPGNAEPSRLRRTLKLAPLRLRRRTGKRQPRTHRI